MLDCRTLLRPPHAGTANEFELELGLVDAFELHLQRRSRKEGTMWQYNQISTESRGKAVAAADFETQTQLN
jgi:hypothetical protein